MKNTFAKYTETGAEQVFEDLKSLADKIATAYPIMLKDKSHLSSMISGGINFALTDTPTNLPFLEAALPPLAKQVRNAPVARALHASCRSHDSSLSVAVQPNAEGLDHRVPGGTDGREGTGGERGRRGLEPVL